VTTLTRYAKATATAVGVALTLIVAYGPAVVGALPADSQITRVLATVVAIATVIVVRAVPNARTLDEAEGDLQQAAAKAGLPEVTVVAAERPPLGRPYATGNVKRLATDDKRDAAQ